MKSSKIYLIQKILFILNLLNIILLIVFNINENLHNLFYDYWWTFAIFIFLLFINNFIYYVKKSYYYIIFFIISISYFIMVLFQTQILDILDTPFIAVPWFLIVSIILPINFIISLIILFINYKKIKINYKKSKEEYFSNKEDIKDKLINSVGVFFANIIDKFNDFRNKIKENKSFKILKRTFIIIIIVVVYNYLTQMLILSFSGFANVTWNSSAEEALYLGINSSYSYVDFGAGAPVWNSDICYGYTYNPFTKTIKLKCNPFYDLDKEDKIIKVEKVDRENGVLILKFYGKNFIFYEDANVFD